MALSTRVNLPPSTKRSLQNEREASLAHDEKIAKLHADERELALAQEKMLGEQQTLSTREGELENAIAQALEDIRTLEAEAVDVKVRISVLENAKNSDTDKNSSALNELAEYQRISDDLKKQCESKENTVAGYDGQISSIDSELMDNEEKEASAEKALEELTGQYNAQVLRVDTVEQRIANFKSMEEHFEGYSNAVRFVMKQYEEGKITDKHGVPAGKIYGPLSKVISVEDRYLTAIEIALGANLQNIVVEDEATAKAAMFSLKRGEAGRATFFPLTSMKPSEDTKEMKDAAGFEGYIGVADDLVSYEPKFANVMSSLLGRTLVFDNIDHATTMAKALRYRVRAVTLDGQQINAGGSFTGGSVRTGQGILSRAGEIKRLESELAQQKKTLSGLQGELDSAKKTVASFEDARLSLQDRRELILVLRNTENAQLEQIRAKLDATETLFDKLKADMSQYEEARVRYESDIETLTAEESNLRLRIREITDFRNEKNAEKGDVILRREEIGRALTELYIHISETQKDIETENTLREGAMARIENLERELTVFEGRINTQNAQISATGSAMETNRAAFEQAKQELEALNAKRTAVEKDNFEFERKLNELNNKMRDKMNHKELLFREFTKCESKLNSLRETQDKLSTKLWDDYELTRSDAVALGYPPVTKENRAELISLQNECRAKLKTLGHVDLDSVNKYAEVKARYDYMSAQITDLEKARKELAGIISQLETEMREVFVNSFNQINENFGKVFAELFGGGSAELSLSDPENVLECGIEIKAAPPGKIIKNLMQLSGGEQAFIGVALFFAILQVNPTPFCILDEIEAALDEVNVERLAQYIKRYSHGTQFIMITHRRGTMAAADRLYGVTMPEHGISKILMLDTNDISKKEGEDWNGIFG